MTLRVHRNPKGNKEGVCTLPWERRAEWMLTIEGLIAVISFVLTAFGLGYAIGSKDSNETQK